jgi:methyl-accepting chemotaxis protein
MKKHKTAINRILAAFLTAVLVLGIALPALAVESDTISIFNAEDLRELSRQCAMDTWSQGKTVVLQADISLDGEDFSPIPIFGGTFDGNGHIISGLDLTEQGYPTGLFGIIQQSGTVKDLTVTGTIAPEGDADTLGGIAGINWGQLVNCTFHGIVDGETTVGGVVGRNESTGQLINCSFQGSITGEHYVGGIAGQNLGSLIRCKNQGCVNTTQIEVEEKLSGIEGFADLREPENVPAGTDIGGIAGYSCGILQSCTNRANVGYDHMGYNVGGIVGRQSGYLDGCVNTGTVKGRKDVGGIAGQMEPQVTLKYSETSLEKLWDELDVLEALVDQTVEHAEGVSDSISGNMSALTDSVSGAKDSVSDLTDSMTGWANENISQINDASARLSWVIDQMEPILDDISASMDDMGTAADALSDAIDWLADAGDPMDEAMEELRRCADDLQRAMDGAEDAFGVIQAAMDALKDGLGDSEETSAALDQLAGGLQKLGNAFANCSVSIRKISEALPETALWLAQNQEKAQTMVPVISTMQEVADALEGVAVETQTVAGAVQAVAANGPTPETLATLAEAAAALDASVDTLNAAYGGFMAALKAYSALDGTSDPEVAEAVADLAAAVEQINAANTDIQGTVNGTWDDEAAALENLSALQTALTSMQTGLQNAATALETMQGLAINSVPGLSVLLEEQAVIRENMATAERATDQITEAVAILAKNIDREDLEKAGEAVKEAMKELEGSSDDLSSAVGHIGDSIDALREAGAISQDALLLAAQAAEELGDAFSNLGDGVDAMKDIFQELSEMPTIQFQTIGSDVTEKGDALDEALGVVLDEMSALNDTMSTSSDILLADIKAINKQMGVVIDTLRSGLESAKDSVEEEHFEDVSDTALDDATARITASRNAGTVEGDINAAGIVGSLAIEYDFDPEDDITESGERTLDFRYQAAAVVRDSRNEGAVTAKRDYAGGIVGRMDLGSVVRCGGYADVSSTDGGYVGGIAGLSRATIRNCFTKCTLSGERYVGGISGAVSEDGTVTGCYAMVEIPGAAQYAGAVSGDDLGKFQANYFVSDTLAGLGRVSYAGRAEPMSYEQLLMVENIPDALRSFTLRFMADDKELKVETFSYGTTFGPETYPSIPVQEGQYGRWDHGSLENLHFDAVVQAIYAPYITTLASEAAREDARPIFYLDGLFQDGDVFSVQAGPTDQSTPEGIPAGSFRKRTLAEHWQLSIPEDGQTTHTLRFLPAEEDVEVWIRTSDGWSQVKTQAVGRYLTFAAEGDNLEIAVCTRSVSGWVWILVGTAAVAALAAAAMWLTKQPKIQAKRSGKSNRKGAGIRA